METMKLGVHDVTTEDLKKITFQVIPQFYWKYNWSYNEFMIHPVGKLEAPSGVIPMYDMLGNVWEWVRDDWTEKVRTSFDGKINPIATGSDHSKKVIRGGAFDQLVRKVISPSREGLTWN
jgi:formylglycine-generating enzyme required for sulfatase activity